MALVSTKEKNSIVQICSICIAIFFILVLFLYYLASHQQSMIILKNILPTQTTPIAEPNVPRNHNPRGVIVTLMRSENRSVARVINMIHTVLLFHSSRNKFLYPFFIFHDQFFTSVMKDRILTCVSKHNKTLSISFIQFNFLTDVPLPATFVRRKTIGYHQMCRFWAYDVFYHPAILQGKYEYLMRMDDDSYFLEKTRIDLFEYTVRKNLDYVYRSWYEEDNPTLLPIEQLFINVTTSRKRCIYNNFFIMRLQWLYKSDRVLRFLHELIRDDLMLREYIGDGCIHAAMLDIDKGMKTEDLIRISYAHNVHRMTLTDWGPLYKDFKDYDRDVANSCDQIRLFLRHGRDPILMKIEDIISKRPLPIV